MHVRLIAVGDRQPSWVDTAFSGYTERLPRNWRFRLDSVSTEQRAKSADIASLKKAEGEKILTKIQPSESVVVLDEHGKQFSSKELADKLDGWQNLGRDLTFVIGGPDGLGDRCLDRADLCWSLSRLTLPHALARIVFAEQIYRAWSMTTGHPYHRA